jgi:hypothetical protein
VRQIQELHGGERTEDGNIFNSRVSKGNINNGMLHETVETWSKVSYILTTLKIQEDIIVGQLEIDNIRIYHAGIHQSIKRGFS